MKKRWKKDWEEIYRQKEQENETQLRLFKYSYPQLYKNLDPLNYSLPSGWNNLVSVLNGKLEDLAIKFGFEVVQVKQKFGGLRFYISVPSKEVVGNEFDAVRGLIEIAENESLEICEELGI